MKVAISSSSFANSFATGELTQLEWLEGSASTLGADGVVFGRAHFPRTDTQYVAQLKKVAVDLGLVPLAVDEPRLFAGDLPQSERHVAIALAAQLGAPFVLTVLPSPGDVPPAAFVAAVTEAKAAAKVAKVENVTLLAQLAPHTLAEDVAGLRHFLKDVDSAWLRYALPAGVDRSVLTLRDRALLITIEASADDEATSEIEDGARPWLLLRGTVDAPRVASLRQAAARKTLLL